MSMAIPGRQDSIVFQAPPAGSSYVYFTDANGTNLMVTFTDQNGVVQPVVTTAS